MDTLQRYLATPLGIWLLRAACIALAANIQGGNLPLDTPIPFLHISVGALLPMLVPLIPSLGTLMASRKPPPP